MEPPRRCTNRPRPGSLPGCQAWRSCVASSTRSPGGSDLYLGRGVQRTVSPFFAHGLPSHGSRLQMQDAFRLALEAARDAEELPADADVTEIAAVLLALAMDAIDRWSSGTVAISARRCSAGPRSYWTGFAQRIRSRRRNAGRPLADPIPPARSDGRTSREPVDARAHSEWRLLQSTPAWR